MRLWRNMTPVAVLAVLALAVAACSSGEGTAPQTGERTVSILAVQHNMDRHVDRTPFPDTLEQYPDLADRWPGYRLDPPDEEGEWYARAYAFSPSVVTVNEGEEVTLQLFGIHGDEHPTVIEGYDVSFNIKRGQVDQVTFVADKPGVFQIICADHMPSMIGQLVVLPTA